MRYRPDAPHEDISRASTLDARFYTDPSCFEASREAIFARSWQLLGDIRELTSPGEVKPITFLPGLLDEPLLLTRDDSSKLHCLSNVCTHRGKLLVDRPCKTGQLRCGYHGRRFRLDGSLVSMPEFEGVVGFPAESDHLTSVPIDSWDPLLFGSLTPAFSLETLLAPVRARLSWLPLEAFSFDPARSKDYEVQAHWALYCENYLEGFHIPFVHKSLNTVLDYGAYETELFPYGVLQLGIARDGEAVFELPQESPDAGRSIAAYYYWLFPNLMLNFYPWGLSINVVYPLGPAHTRVSFLSYVWKPEKLETGAGAGLDRVELEDEAVVEQVQQGIRSRFYSRGRYSPTREQGTHHFHRLIAAFMARG